MRSLSKSPHEPIMITAIMLIHQGFTSYILGTQLVTLQKLSFNPQNYTVKEMVLSSFYS